MNYIRCAHHVHTEASKDASFKFQGLLNACKRFQIGAVTVTDHNTMDGYFRLQELCLQQAIGLKIVPGEEIATQSGEVMGLFLTEAVPARLPLDKTIEAIKAQKGLVCLPHPFDSVRRERIRDKSLLEKIIADVDLVEVFNSRNMKSADNDAASRFAADHQKAPIWGSDAHFSYEFSKCFFEMPDFRLEAVDYLEKLKSARPLVLKKSYRGFLQSCFRKYVFFSIFK